MEARTVWKYPLRMEMPTPLDLPAGAEPIHFGMQGRTPTMWAMCDPEQAPVHSRLFVVVGTGFELTGGELKHIGSTVDGPFVWHLFEMLPVEDA